MSTADPITDSARGYLSQEAKRRFTLVAGTLGAVLFLAQVVLPFLVMLLVMFPMMFGAMSVADLDQAALWRNELWFIARSARLNWRELESSSMVNAASSARSLVASPTALQGRGMRGAFGPPSARGC